MSYRRCDAGPCVALGNYSLGDGPGLGFSLKPPKAVRKVAAKVKAAVKKVVSVIPTPLKFAALATPLAPAIWVGAPKVTATARKAMIGAALVAAAAPAAASVAKSLPISIGFPSAPPVQPVPPPVTSLIDQSMNPSIGTGIAQDPYGSAPAAGTSVAAPNPEASAAGLSGGNLAMLAVGAVALLAVSQATRGARRTSRR